jgi:hypothetical protein
MTSFFLLKLPKLGYPVSLYHGFLDSASIFQKSNLQIILKKSSKELTCRKIDVRIGANQIGGKIDDEKL